MGLNINVLRRLIPPSSINQNEKGTEIGGDIETKPQEPPLEKDAVNALINTYTYFSVYEGITNSLGNFYSENLAKMTGPDILNKRIFNQLYNGVLNRMVNNALESAKSGEKLDFTQLAQNVKDQITAELEACNYNSIQYQQNQIDKNITELHNLFNK